MPARVARVLPDSPLPQLDQLYDYLIPERLAERAVPGSRVRMPFRHGTRLMSGWLVECVEESSYQGELAQLHDVITEVPPLTPAVWQLVRACADRAAGNAADLLRLAVPPRHAGGASRRCAAGRRAFGG